MDKRSLIAIALSILILIAYQEFIAYFYPPTRSPESQPPTESFPPPPAAPLAQPADKAKETTESASPVEAGVSAPPERNVTVETEVYTAVFTSRGGRLKSLTLKYYPGDAGRDSPPLEMVKEAGLSELPLGFRLEGKDSVITDDAVSYEVQGGDLRLQGDETASLEYKGKTPEGTLLTKTFSFSGQTYGIALNVKAEGAPESVSFASLVWPHVIEHHRDASYQQHGPVALVDRKFSYEAATSLAGKENILGPGRIRWGGFTDTYFLTAMIPPEGDSYRLFLSGKNGTVEAKLSIPWTREPIAYTLYAGPKEFTALNAVNPALDRAIDFGWFHFIARPLVYLLRLSHTLTGNYGIDIILLTLLVKLAFFPLTNKSFKSMAQMRELQPQMERLREQYKDDREKLNKEMMELYRRYKINPLGGSLATRPAWYSQSLVY
jgi:YidC/Oxa1 family membrane protein insertase